MIIQPNQNDWLSCGTAGDITGQVSNACGQDAQRGCESVYQNGGAQRPVGYSVESDNTQSRFPSLMF